MIPYDDLTYFFRDYMEQLSLSVDEIAEVTQQVAQTAAAAVINERKLIVCGIGPDAPNASLLVELLQQGLYRERPAIPAIELTSRHLVSLEPGVGWLSQQLTALGQPGDLVLIFATSLNQLDLDLLAATLGKRGLQSTWVGVQGPGTSLAFSGVERSTALALSHNTVICLARLIDITLFGPLEDRH